jgi:GNAT superfamily N-acetyltransferase
MRVDEMKVHIRKLLFSDRSSFLTMLARVREFDIEDQAVVVELLDLYLTNPIQKDYVFQVAVDYPEQIVGFICYGPTPLTEGTYDLYWIAVDPEFAGRGVGTQIIEQMENDLINLHARLVIIETTSARKYSPTRQFYLKNGYSLAEVIPDFYRRGEDRVTFSKYLSPEPSPEIQYGYIEWIDI